MAHSAHKDDYYMSEFEISDSQLQKSADEFVALLKVIP